MQPKSIKDIIKENSREKTTKIGENVHEEENSSINQKLVQLEEVAEEKMEEPIKEEKIEEPTREEKMEEPREGSNYFNKIILHSKKYEKGEDYIKVKVNSKSLMKLKMLCSNLNLTQQGITAYLIESFLEKNQVKKALEKLKNELD